MCKVFKIKTSSGLVTTTTDPEIVRCLLDNYDGELSIETKKQVCDESQLAESEKVKCTSIGLPEITEDDCLINAQPYTGTNKFAYIKALQNILNIRLWTIKEYTDNGFKIPVNTKALFNDLTVLLNAFHVPYTIEKTEHKELFCFTLPAYHGCNKLEYIEELIEILNIRSDQADCIADDGGKIFRNNLDEANRFKDMLRKHEINYIETICKLDED